jgi:hypothetical protein
MENLTHHVKHTDVLILQMLHLFPTKTCTSQSHHFSPLEQLQDVCNEEEISKMPENSDWGHDFN